MKYREKRSSICGTVIDTSETFWTAGEKGGFLKQNKRILFSKIDYLQSLSTIAETQDEVLRAYNDMDYYYILVKLIDVFGYDNNLLYLSFLESHARLNAGEFDVDSIDLDYRNEYFTSLLETIITDTNNNSPVNPPVDDFYIELYSELVNNNLYVNAITDEYSTEPSTQVSGEDRDWCAELKTQGVYFTYSQAKASKFVGSECKKAQVKRVNQQNLVNRLCAVNPQFAGGVGVNLINSGIIDKTGGTADDVVDTIKTPKSSVSGLILGLTIGAFVKLCVTVIVAICAVWAAYIEMKKAKIDRETAELLSKQNVNANCPADGDFGFLNGLADTDGDGKVSSEEAANFVKKVKKICIIGAGVLLLYNFL